MFRTALVNTARPLVARRTFAYTARAMAGGDTGSGYSRSGGEAAGDAFTKRESASENLYIKQEEAAKLKALKAKVESAQKHMAELQQHINDLTKEQGGEQH